MRAVCYRVGVVENVVVDALVLDEKLFLEIGTARVAEKAGASGQAAVLFALACGVDQAERVGEKASVRQQVRAA